MQDSPSISQFSALTLRRAFKLGRTKRLASRRHHYQEHHRYHHELPPLPLLTKDDQRKDSRANSSSSIAASTPPKDLSELLSASSSLSSPGSSTITSTSHKTRSVICICCCCTNRCVTSTTDLPPAGVMAKSSQQKPAAEVASYMPANQPTRQSNVDSTSAAAAQLGHTNASHWRRWQKTSLRMPIPVPPPIVPLHRQLACTLHEDESSSSSSSSSSSCNVYENSSSAPLTFRLHESDEKCKFILTTDKHSDHELSRSSSATTILLARNAASKLSAAIGCGMSAAYLGGSTMGTDYEGNWTELDGRRHPSQANPSSSTKLSYPNDNNLDLHATRLLGSGLNGQNEELLLLSSSFSYCSNMALRKDGSPICDLDYSTKTSGIQTIKPRADMCAQINNRDRMVEKKPKSLSNINSQQQMIASGKLVVPPEGSDDKSNSEKGSASPIVDINFRNLESGKIEACKTPQALEETVAHEATPKQRTPTEAVSAIYDLPESSGAREFVRVEVCEGKRTVTSSRLPQRPAKRPVMPPPPPPPPLPQKRQQQRERSFRCERNATNGDCVVANFSANPALDYASNVSTQAPNRQLRSAQRTNHTIKPEPQRISPVTEARRQSILFSKTHNHLKNEPITSEPLHQLSTSKSVHFELTTVNNRHSAVEINTTESEEKQSKQPQSNEGLVREFHKEENGTTRSKRVNSIKEIRHRREYTTSESSAVRLNEQVANSSSNRNKFNMGSSHSSSAAAPEVRGERRQQASSKEQNNKREHSAPIKTKSREGKNSVSAKKHGYAVKEFVIKQPASSDGSEAPPNEISGAPPSVNKSLSNMTNKLVGESKIMTGSSSNARDPGHHNGGTMHSTNMDTAGGKQHVQSALQMCIKGVVKPVVNKGLHHHNNNNHHNHFQANNRSHDHQYGRHLERPRNSVEDSLERRRKSLQDGDVFIYPRLYKDLNECRKCLRDNRICNCIEIELSSDGSSSTTAAALTGEIVSPTIEVSDPSLNARDNESLKSEKIDHHEEDVRKACENDKSAHKSNTTAASNEQAPESSSTLRCSINRIATGDNPSPSTKDENNNTIAPDSADLCSQMFNDQAYGCAKLGVSQFKKVNLRRPCSGNESESLVATTENDIAPQEPSNSEQPLISSDGAFKPTSDYSEQAATTYVTDATASMPTSTKRKQMRRSSDDFVVVTTANSAIAEDDTTHDSSPLSLGAIDDCFPSASKQQYSILPASAKVKRSLTSVSLVSQKSLPTTRVESNITKISIGGSASQTRNDINTSPLPSKSYINTSISSESMPDHAEKGQSHTSIVSIQTRRKNMATHLGSKRAIYEDQDTGEQQQQQQQQSNFTNDNSADGPCKTSTSLLPLDISPGVAVGTPTESQLLSERILLSEPITFRDSLSPISKDNASAVLDYSPILSSVRDYIKNMNTELQVQTSMASPLHTSSSSATVQASATDFVIATIPSTIPSSLASCSSASNGLVCSKTLALESPIQVVTSSAGIVQATFTTAVPAASIKAHVQTASSCVSVSEADVSPKKSIFEGASKDEILEYLEDARERVPEILMAADDVMVINENELIVVNQLEPNSPATPISIVETNEVVSGAESGCTDTISSPLIRSSSKSSQHHPLTHPDQLRQHLEQMYQTSQLAAAAAAAQAASVEGQPGVVKDIQPLDLFPSPELELTKFPAPETGIDSPDFRPLDKIEVSKAGDTSEQDMANLKFEQQELQKQQPSPACDRNEDIATAMVSQCGLIVGLLNFASPMYAGRRNSASEGSIQPGNSRENAMQILALQKHYTNRNSLSSPSTSPPSSASPSSSSSSNQTSGNCSAATSFYASSSLSCSSPLLNLAGPFSSSNSPAFNQSVPPPVKAPISDSGCMSPMNLAHKFDDFELKLLNQNIAVDGQSSSRATPDSSDQATLMSPNLMKSVINGTDSTPFIRGKPNHVDRDDSGTGSELATSRLRSMTISGEQTSPRGSSLSTGVVRLDLNARSNSETGNLNNTTSALITTAKLSRIDETSSYVKTATQPSMSMSSNPKCLVKTNTSNARFSSQPNNQNGIGIASSRGHGHYNTLSRLNNYFMNRHPFSSSSDSTVEFQCLDCDQFIDVDQATIMNKTNELRLLRATDSEGRLDCLQHGSDGKEMSPEQLDRAYVAAMNGLPLCKTCEKKRIERKEIISEFVETELKYGRDLKIIHDEFYRPMQIAGLLTKEQINGVFLNLEELIMAHCKFADRLETAIREAHSIGDTDFNTVNIGGLFLESAEMLNTFESYCIRQGAAACLLARLAKERELLRIFLRVSQMENTLLRRMNLAAFLMVPVQRVTKYPLLLNRLYKVTAYHHKDRESLRDAQLKVELHLEHINQQTKGIGASNKIWRRISSLSAPISNRRGLMNAEDIGFIKLRKTAMDMLKWDRDETQFIHSGKIHFAPLNEYLTRQKMKPIRYLPAHALLIVLGRPNWKYRPDLVKANLDSKLMTPTPGGTEIKEAALLLFREKNGRFVPCREPLLLSNCVLSADCSQFNNECPPNQPNIMRQNNQQQQQQQLQHNSSTSSRKSGSSCSSGSEITMITTTTESSPKFQESRHGELSQSGSQTGSIDSTTTHRSMSPRDHESRAGSLGGDVALISSFRGLIEDGVGSQGITSGGSPQVAAAGPHSSRSYSLASALPRNTLTSTNSTVNLSKPIMSTASSNLTILNQLMTKVNSYHNRQSSNQQGGQGKLATPLSTSADLHQSGSKHKSVSPSVSADINSATSIPSSAIAIDQMSLQAVGHTRPITVVANNSPSGSSSNGSSSGRASSVASDGSGQPNYNSYNYFHYNHHQPYGDYEESFEIHERVGKESMLLRADTPLKTRYWLQMLRYHAKDLGQWRSRRNGLPNIMMMRHE